MSTLEDLPLQWLEELERVGADAPLADLQYAYKKIVVQFGLLILNRFSDDLVGSKPTHGGAGAHGPGDVPHRSHPPSAASHGPGEVPHILRIAGVAMELQDCE